MTGPRRVAALRHQYEDIQRSPVSDDAPLEQQHAYWRIHDAAKHEYAAADWQWESLILRVLIAVSLLTGVASLFLSSVSPLGVILVALTIAQCYRIFTRLAPE